MLCDLLLVAQYINEEQSKLIFADVHLIFCVDLDFSQFYTTIFSLCLWFVGRDSVFKEEQGSCMVLFGPLKGGLKTKGKEPAKLQTTFLSMAMQDVKFYIVPNKHVIVTRDPTTLKKCGWF